MKREYKSFLIINPFGIGDVLFSTPLIRNIKEEFPLAKIFYLCNKRTAPLLETNPLVYKTFVYERDDFDKLRKTSKALWIKTSMAFLSQIKKEKIDAALDLSLNSQFGFFAWYAGIKKRIGLDYKKRGRFLTHKIKIDGYNDKHVVEYYLDLLSLLGIDAKKCGLEVYPGRKSELWSNEFIDRENLKGKLIIGIVPCGGEAFGKDAYIRRWPQDKFILLIRRMIKEFEATVFIFAGPKERKEVKSMLSSLGEAALRCYEFTSMSLNKIIALIDKCSLVVANDTGPMHFAQALGKKIVTMFGPVDERVYGPYFYKEGRTVVLKKDLPCRPCYKKFKLPACPYDKKCLKDISVNEVFDAAKRLINNISS